MMPKVTLLFSTERILQFMMVWLTCLPLLTQADTTDPAQVSLQINTDKPTYQATALMQLQASIQNQTSNVSLENIPVYVTVRAPNQQIIYATTREIDSLEPQATQDLSIPYMLKSAIAGTYIVDMAILGADSSVLTSQIGIFDVEESLASVLSGSISVQSVAQTQQCTFSIINSSNQVINALPLQYALVNAKGQTVIEAEAEAIDLAENGLYTKVLEYFTHTLPAAEYACLLQVQIEGEWQILDFQAFKYDNVLATECSTVYAIHDQSSNDSQLFRYDLNQHSITALGDVYPELDLEGMDIHPYTRILYASTGRENAALYQVDGFTGELTLVGLIGFDDVDALSFDATGQLWGWSAQGLIQIDTTTGQGQLVLANTTPVEGLAWNNDGSLLYATAKSEAGFNSTLWAYDPTTNSLTEHCHNLGGEIESLEMLPDNTLAFGVHNDNQLGLYAYDAATCQVVEQAKIATPFNDIEAVAWPAANCTSQQTALRAFFSALSDNAFIGANRKIRFTVDGLTYAGQLAESTIQGEVPANGELNLNPIPDANNDGLDDFLITYPDGTQQILYYLGLDNVALPWFTQSS
ncbi:hypothetical protein [Candidatus Albibeggiatoa sp. nov. NOAA]|uniref:hypothetical protein n=1 Tax=Candidatus Albibeggiatoa sp. nov. NOAA TaxID=3162724 RepID=UPI0032FCE00B|nr:hypothetical protein [Thiotrichaceae bacterium]